MRDSDARERKNITTGKKQISYRQESLAGDKKPFTLYLISKFENGIDHFVDGFEVSDALFGSREMARVVVASLLIVCIKEERTNDQALAQEMFPRTLAQERKHAQSSE